MRTKTSFLAPAALFSGLALFLTGCVTGPNLFQRLINITGQGPCIAVIVILDVIFLFELFNGSKSSGDKLLWALIIIFIPIAGCFLYYFLGRSKSE